MMHVVHSVKPKKRQVLVSFDDGKNLRDFLVSEELFLDFRLVKGKELTENDYQKFLTAHAKDSIYQKILHFALFKPRCTHEMIEFFERTGIPETDFKYYLHKLYTTKIVDDEAYVRSYINDAVELKLYGPRKIVYDLDNKRLKKELYQDVLSEIPKTRILENIRNLFDKKLAGTKPQSVAKAIITIKQFIINKGYDFEDVDLVINENIERIQEKTSEDQALVKDVEQALRKYRQEDKNKKEKIYGYLLRKGYAYHKIKAKLGEYDE